jgi:hypothetical protein
MFQSILDRPWLAHTVLLTLYLGIWHRRLQDQSPTCLCLISHSWVLKCSVTEHLPSIPKAQSLSPTILKKGREGKGKSSVWQSGRQRAPKVMSVHLGCFRVNSLHWQATSKNSSIVTYDQTFFLCGCSTGCPDELLLCAGYSSWFLKRFLFIYLFIYLMTTL